MLTLPLRSELLAGPFSIMFMAILVQALEPHSGNWLAFERAAFESGEFWRLLSGNLAHTNLNHLLLNSAGLTLLWALHGEYYRPLRFYSVFVLCGLGCTLGIYLFDHQLSSYVGLSGVIHGLFAWGAYMDIRRGLKTGWLLMLGLWAKVLHEQLYGASEDVAALIQASVAVDAHLYGAFTGCLIALYFYLRPRQG